MLFKPTDTDIMTIIMIFNMHASALSIVRLKTEGGLIKYFFV